MSFTPLIFASEKDSPPNAPLKSRVPWPYAVACCLYYLLIYRWFALATPIFAKLREGLGIVIPLPTRLLMATYRWVYPVLFVGAAALTIVKQFVPLEKPRLRITNLFLIFAGIVFPPLVVLAWYWPLFDLIWKLKAARGF
jgi:hypothetical protein